MVDQKNEGTISEWNEGDLKTLRLHKAQEIINITKSNPFASHEKGRIGFESWFNWIDVLFGEGMEKYSATEYTEVKKLRDKVEKMVLEKGVYSIGKTNHGNLVRINPDKWNKVKKELQEFEYKVKYYNNAHGLSTRNVKGRGMF